LNGKQELVLLRLDALGARCFLTEMKKLADSVPEFGE
jgi:hypothetical protein